MVVVNNILNFLEVQHNVLLLLRSKGRQQSGVRKRQKATVKILIVVILDEQRTRTLTLITWRWRCAEVGVSSRDRLALTWVTVNHPSGRAERALWRKWTRRVKRTYSWLLLWMRDSTDWKSRKLHGMFLTDTPHSSPLALEPMGQCGKERGLIGWNIICRMRITYVNGGLCCTCRRGGGSLYGIGKFVKRDCNIAYMLRMFIINGIYMLYARLWNWFGKCSG